MGIVSPYTATTAAELNCIARHSKGARIAVEIGTFMGASAVVIAQTLADDGRLYCVDPYYDGEALRSICVRHLRRRKLLQRIVMVRKSSCDALDELPAQVDFIFVDGDHSWKGIQTDWSIVEMLLRPGGIACFHDTSPPPENPHNWRESARYFAQVIKPNSEYEHLETCATLNVIRRIHTPV